MQDSGLHGPHDLDSYTLKSVVKGVGPGAYALGSTNSAGGLNIRYVGRSDSDLEARLQHHANDSVYPQFKYGFLSNAKAAFDKECALYHDFSPPDNKVHPARANSAWKCPRCNVFGCSANGVYPEVTPTRL